METIFGETPIYVLRLRSRKSSQKRDVRKKIFRKLRGLFSHIKSFRKQLLGKDSWDSGSHIFRPYLKTMSYSYRETHTSLLQFSCPVFLNNRSLRREKRVSGLFYLFLYTWGYPLDGMEFLIPHIHRSSVVYKKRGQLVNDVEIKVDSKKNLGGFLRHSIGEWCRDKGGQVVNDTEIKVEWNLSPPCTHLNNVPV